MVLYDHVVVLYEHHWGECPMSSHPFFPVTTPPSFPLAPHRTQFTGLTTPPFREAPANLPATIPSPTRGPFPPPEPGRTEEGEEGARRQGGEPLIGGHVHVRIEQRGLPRFLCVRVSTREASSPLDVLVR